MSGSSKNPEAALARNYQHAYFTSLKKIQRGHQDDYVILHAGYYKTKGTADTNYLS